MAPPAARDRILDAARALVLERGFSATTVDAVLDAAPASKGAFFHHFPSKAHLGLALVERYAAADAAVLDAALSKAEAETDDPAEQLIAFTRGFEAAAESVLEDQPSCLFVSFIYERELGDVGTGDVVAESILHWRRRIVEKLRLAAEDRPAMAAVDLPSLADHWFTTFEGAFLLAQALDDRRCMRQQVAHLRRYLELLFGLPATP